jgi:hypothetical protein
VPPPPGPPTRATRATLCPSREPPETLAAAAVETSSPPPLRRREAAQEPRKEVRSIPTLLVVIPVLHTARSRSQEFDAAPSRAATLSVVAVASPLAAPP